MKIVEFTKLGLQNFCCHIEPIEIEFEKGKLTMITGRNGSGKTAIFQSLPYALYGVCEKGRGEDVLNDKTKKNCHTFVEFKIDEKEYRVDRYVKYTRKGNTVTLSDKKNDKWDVLFKGHKEVLPEIEKMLMPYKLFINTLLFSQKVKTFFTDLNDSEQKEIFRKILKLDDYVLYQKQANEDLKKCNETTEKLHNNISTKAAIIDSNLEEIENLKIKKVEFEKEKVLYISKLESEIFQFEENIANVDIKIEAYEEMKLEKALSSIDEKLGSISNQLSSLSGEVESQLRELESQAILKSSQIDNKYMSEKEKIEQDGNNKDLHNEQEYVNVKTKLDESLVKIQNEITKLKNQETELNTNNNNEATIYMELSKSLKMKGGTCPTCYQDIGDNAEKVLNKKMDDSKLKLDNIKAELQSNFNIQAELSKEKDKLQIQINDLYQNLLEKKKEVESYINEDITQLKGKVGETKTKLHNMVASHTKSIQSQIKERKKELENEQHILRQDKDSKQELLKQKGIVVDAKVTCVNELATRQAQLKAKQDDTFEETPILRLNEKCEILRNESVELENQIKVMEKIIKALEFWKVGFSSSGIQSMLIDEAIPFMNRKASYYLDKISGGRYKVVFDTLKATKDAKEFRDKISVEVFDTFTHADKRVKFSGGQERVVDISTILTLSDLQSNIQDISFNLLLFDEIFDALDDENIGNVSGLIRQIASEKWIGLISHRHIDQVDSDDVIKLY